MRRHVGRRVRLDLSKGRGIDCRHAAKLDGNGLSLVLVDLELGGRCPWLSAETPKNGETPLPRSPAKPSKAPFEGFEGGSGMRVWAIFRFSRERAVVMELLSD